jgi:hypothetical protein
VMNEQGRLTFVGSGGACDGVGRSIFDGSGRICDEAGRRFCIIGIDDDGGFGKEVGAEL